MVYNLKNILFIFFWTVMDIQTFDYEKLNTSDDQDSQIEFRILKVHGLRGKMSCFYFGYARQ